MTKRKACYEDPDTGLLHRWPVSREEARKMRLPRFTDLAGCRRCEASGGLPGPKARYVEGAECVGCLHLDAPAILQAWRSGAPGAPAVVALSAEEALRCGADFYVGGDSEQGLLCRNGPHLRLTHVVTGRCVECSARREVSAREPTPRALARRAGLPRYVPAAPCSACGQLAERDVVTNRCYGCSPVGPRKVARRAGHRYYAPETACPDCGERAPRDVVTNRCTGCVKHGRARREVVGDARMTAASRMAAECPDLVLTRKDAKALGLAVYRTGEPCAYGHTGYRYVSTGACIACLRARPRSLKA